MKNNIPYLQEVWDTYDSLDKQKSYTLYTTDSEYLFQKLSLNYENSGFTSKVGSLALGQ